MELMKAQYHYLVTGFRQYPVSELLDWEGFAYTDKQAIYFFKQKHGYKGIRDIKPRRGMHVVAEGQVEINVG